MDIVYTDRHRAHAPKAFLVRGRVVPNFEVPERADRLMGALGGRHHVSGPQAHGMAPLAAVHDEGYLDFLKTGHARWRTLPGAGEEILPNVHPGRNMHHRPTGIVGLAGLYMADTACPIGAGTWDAVTAAADVALTATRKVIDGAPVAYGLCRPPGHHAYADQAGGFCYLNNAAIAAQHLRDAGHARVAVLDVDVHHGNGTQGIFWRRGDVFFASVHAEPSSFYPFYAGYEEETGEGEGAGANLNLPLDHGSGDAPVLAAVERTLAAIRRHGASALVVSVGFDASERDPFAVLRVTTEGFGAIASRIAGLGLPAVLIDRKSTRLNSSHNPASRMPSSA
jgi:acetoin utilization deacetylase AcuC-like enzyme